MNQPPEPLLFISKFSEVRAVASRKLVSDSRNIRSIRGGGEHDLALTHAPMGTGVVLPGVCLILRTSENSLSAKFVSLGLQGFEAISCLLRLLVATGEYQGV